jgi:hypothetical protein
MCGRKFAGIWLALALALCLAPGLSFGSPDAMRPIYDSELQTLLRECAGLRVSLRISLDSLDKAELTRRGLETDLLTRQRKIDGLLEKSADLEESLLTAGGLLSRLSVELTALKKSFDEYRDAVQSKLARLEAEKFFQGVGCFVVGAGASAAVFFGGHALHLW